MISVFALVSGRCSSHSSGCFNGGYHCDFFCGGAVNEITICICHCLYVHLCSLNTISRGRGRSGDFGYSFAFCSECSRSFLSRMLGPNIKIVVPGS